jgi:hypothetical protein
MRQLSQQHKAAISRHLKGNKNAVKSGRFSRVPHATVCAQCLRIMFCPYYKSGNACIFVWEKMEKTAEDLRRKGWLL